MKNRSSRFLLITAAVGLVWVLGGYLALDTGLSGAIADWFESHFMIEYGGWKDEQGHIVYYRQPHWTAVKQALLPAALGILVIVIALLALVNHYWTKARLRQATAEISGLMEEFMHTGKSASLVFPKEYGDIAVQMSDIRNDMEHHERLLREEEARKNDLITYLAHDLKTPLTSIIGYLSLLQEAPDLPTEQRIKYVDITLEKAQRLEHLINEFFDITRYNLQQMQLEVSDTDLSYMLIQLSDEFYPLLERHGNRIALHAADHLHLVCDANKMARVFNNLLKNAITYSTADTVIDITAEESADALTIAFSNEGPTIPAEKLAQLFDKFFRVDESRSTQTGGAGLGLAIAKDIVTAHVGSLTAKSADGHTTFCVRLPRMPHQSA